MSVAVNVTICLNCIEVEFCAVQQGLQLTEFNQNWPADVLDLDLDWGTWTKALTADTEGNGETACRGQQLGHMEDTRAVWAVQIAALHILHGHENDWHFLDVFTSIIHKKM